MNLTNLKRGTEMHMADLSSTQLCAGTSYWGQVEFTSTPSNNEQDPITKASFYKDTGN